MLLLDYLRFGTVDALPDNPPKKGEKVEGKVGGWILALKAI